MQHPLIRTVKLGGSLLDWPQFIQQLTRWIIRQAPAINVLVIGGGEFAEELRRLDTIHGLSPRDAHWLAAETMQITSKLVAKLLPESAGLWRFDRLLSEIPPVSVVVFDAWQFLCDVEPTLPGNRLPENWSTTSDSIAARLASALNADELVLLKSALPEPLQRRSLSELTLLAESGYVDPALPQVAAGLKRLRCVNLRDNNFAELQILPPTNGPDSAAGRSKT